MPVATPTMASRLENTSAILGEYMLKGWTLTDLHCDTCNITPLMREPAAQASREGRGPIQFCAYCDGGPSGEPSTSSIPADAPNTSPAPASAPIQVEERDTTKGDAAADQISHLLLQGYSLLNENCPTPECRGIPLVGYPRRKDGSKDGRKMCVSCGGRWVAEGSMDGMIPITSSSSSAGAVGARSPGSGNVGGESPRSKKRRELYEVGAIIREERSANAELQDKDKARAPAPLAFSHEEDDALHVEGNADPITPNTNTTTSPLDTSLQSTTSALASTLDRLASSLSSHTANSSKADESRYFVDVKLHTEAMRDVLAVLGMVDKLQRSK